MDPEPVTGVLIATELSWQLLRSGHLGYLPVGILDLDLSTPYQILRSPDARVGEQWLLGSTCSPTPGTVSLQSAALHHAGPLGHGQNPSPGLVIIF